jgi:hypothetical protein
MQRSTRRTLGTLLLLATAAAPLAAQVSAAMRKHAPDPVTAKAPTLWASGGVGPGWFRLSCPLICEGDREMGYSGQLAGGVQFGRLWLAGIQLTGYLDERDAIRERAIFVGPSVRWYPTPKSRLWLKLSAGILSWRADDPDDDDDEPLTASPFAGEVGVGYDVPVAKRLWLAPFFSFTGTAGGSVSVDGQTVTDDPNFSLVQFGASLTWR